MTLPRVGPMKCVPYCFDSSPISVVSVATLSSTRQVRLDLHNLLIINIILGCFKFDQVADTASSSSTGTGSLRCPPRHVTDQFSCCCWFIRCNCTLLNGLPDQSRVRAGYNVLHAVESVSIVYSSADSSAPPETSSSGNSAAASRTSTLPVTTSAIRRVRYSRK